MEIACPNILNSTNYFQWLSYMINLLRSKGIYRIPRGQETKPPDKYEVAKWENKQYQARGLIEMSIGQDLRFHIQEIDSPHEAMKKLNIVFGIQNEIRAQQLANVLLTLDPNNLSSIEDFLSKFKTLRLILEGCKVKKEDGSLVYSILSMLVPT